MHCKCIEEPRGRSGLEGYQLGDTYRYEYMEEKNYYRVYPSDTDYYETCGPVVFHKYFEEEGHS